MTASEHLIVATRSLRPEAPADGLGARSAPAATFATTEHFNPPTARALTLAIPVAVGAVVGAGAFSLQERRHRRARDNYSPDAVDRAAILIPSSRPADSA